MKPVHAAALPALVAVLGLVAALGAVRRGYEPPVEPDVPRPGTLPTVLEPAQGARLTSAQRSLQSVEPRPQVATTAERPAPAASATKSQPAKSEVGLPRDYKPSLTNADLDEVALSAHVETLMPLGADQLQSLRQRYLGLPSRLEDLLTTQELPEGDFAYEQALEGLCDEIEVLLKDCHRDYYQQGRFPHRRADGNPLAARPVGDSQFTTHGLFLTGGWYVDAGFRSADYPTLERKLSEALQLRIQRVDFLERELGGI